jgi:hypothetical protein
MRADANCCNQAISLRTLNERNGDFSPKVPCQSILLQDFHSAFDL